MMTLDELQRELDERSLTLTVHGSSVWLHAADDPGLGVIVCDLTDDGGPYTTLEDRVRRALKQWDQAPEKEVPN